jgi:hypothetical protein
MRPFRQNHHTGMCRTFFNGTMPLAKHFTRRRDDAHRLGATHRPLKSKAPKTRTSRKARRFCAQSRPPPHQNHRTGMRTRRAQDRTFFNGNLPIAKHFAPRRDDAHRLGATHLSRPLETKAPKTRTSQKAPRFCAQSRSSPPPRGCDHLNKITAQGCVAPSSTGICQSTSILPLEGTMPIVLVRRIAR